MKFKNRRQKIIAGTGALIGIIVIGAGIYTYNRLNSLSARIDTLTANVEILATTLSSTTEELTAAISQTHTTLSSAINDEKQQLGNFQSQVQNQVGGITGTLTNIQKLSQLDPELLKKYSKVYFLNDNYVPSSLSEIPPAYEYSDTKALLIHSKVLPYFESMINNASSTGIKLYALSAYRSFDEQRALKGIYTVTYGAGTANSFSADQGYSEHQLGTAVDFITTGLGGVLDGFDNTKAYQWMLANAYKYGFILSYPKDNDYYVYEPWHWRFVGVKLATDLHNQNQTFYSLDQRVIDTYLISIFD